MSDKSGSGRSSGLTNQVKPASRIAQAMHYVDEKSGAVVPPIVPSATFARDENLEMRDGYLYSRRSTPNARQLEKILSELDCGEGALAFASGLAAFSALMETVKSGGHVVIPQVMYFAGQNWLRKTCAKRSIELSEFDPADENSLQRCVQPGRTSIVWIETPANPNWVVTDIAAAAKIAHNGGAILVADCTCSPPVTTLGLKRGADIVFHSATKYLNGHSDLTAGVLVTKSNNQLWEEIASNREYLGSIIGPFEAWLLIRGLRTLFVRFNVASNNAMKFARHFHGHPNISQVLYPGLPSHAQHEIAKSQMTSGFGGMMSILVDGDYEATRKVTAALKLFLPATSLGGVESLAEHRKGVEGPTSTVPDNLIRLSIGIEDVDDLIADLEQALLLAK